MITNEDLVRRHYHQRLELDNYIMFCVECRLGGPSNDFGWRCNVYKDAVAKLDKVKNTIMSEDRIPNHAKSNEMFSLEDCAHEPSLWRDGNNYAICTMCHESIFRTSEFGWVSTVLAEQYDLW